MSELDYTPLLNIIKELAAGAIDSKKLFSFCIGKVVAPQGSDGKGLKIRIEQRLTLGDKQLLLTNAVRDHYVKLTTVGETLNQQDGKEHNTEYEENLALASGVAAVANAAPGTNYDFFAKHRHEYKGDKWFKVNRKLQVGESVILLRVDGGQKYIVLDRVYPPNNKGEIR